jgi:hypothetical protein
LKFEVIECKSLVLGVNALFHAADFGFLRILVQLCDAGRGLHSSTFRLSLSVFRRCQGVSRNTRGCLDCILCQKRLRLS